MLHGLENREGPARGCKGSIPLPSSDSHEIAWAAGFIDGEGSFGVQRQTGHPDLPYLQASQVDRYVLDRVCAALGVGKVYGPYKTSGNVGRDYFYWRATGRERVVIAWNLISPWLSPVKKEQYETMIRSC